MMMTIIVARAGDLVRLAMASAVDDACNTMRCNDVSKWITISMEMMMSTFRKKFFLTISIFKNILLTKYNKDFILSIVHTQPRTTWIDDPAWRLIASFSSPVVLAPVATKSIWDDELRGLKAIAGVNSVITSKPRPGSLCIASRCGHDVRGILHAATPRLRNPPFTSIYHNHLVVGIVAKASVTVVTRQFRYSLERLILDVIK